MNNNKANSKLHFRGVVGKSIESFQDVGKEEEGAKKQDHTGYNNV